MSANSNAYEMDRFVRKPATSERNLTVVRTNRQAKQAARRKYVAMLRSTMVLLVVIVIAGTYLFSKVQITELTEQINAAEKSLNAEQSENVRLQLQVEGQLSMNNIEQYAADLGLSKLQQYQVTCVCLNAEDVITISSSNRGFFGEVWDAISGFFGAIAAYIGQ